MKITYVGPHEAVDIDDLGHGFIRSGVQNGETIDVPAEVGNGLLEQGPDHWQPAAAAKTTPKKEG